MTHPSDSARIRNMHPEGCLDIERSFIPEDYTVSRGDPPSVEVPVEPTPAHDEVSKKRISRLLGAMLRSS